MAERQQFTHMDNALSSLFEQLEVEHDSVLAPPDAPVAGCSLDAAGNVDGQGGSCGLPHDDVSAGSTNREGHATSPENADMQNMATHPPVSECTPETPDRTPISGEGVMDVATAARLAFHEERRKAGHARKALRCPSTVHIDQSDASPPPAVRIAKKPPVPSFRLSPAPAPCQQQKQQQSTDTASALLPAIKNAVAHGVQGTLCTDADAARKESHLSCDGTQSTEPQHRPVMVGADLSPMAEDSIELHCSCEPQSGVEACSSAESICTQDVAATQVAGSTRHERETEKATTGHQTMNLSSPYDFTVTSDTHSSPQIVQLALETQPGGDSTFTSGSVPPGRHMDVDFLSSGAEHEVVQSCQNDSGRRRKSREGGGAQCATCTFAQHGACGATTCALEREGSDSGSCEVLLSSEAAASKPAGGNSPSQHAAASPLVLEDSYTGSEACDDSDGSTGGLNVENSPPGGAPFPIQHVHVGTALQQGSVKFLKLCLLTGKCTHVALAKTDAAKMALHSWSAFQAVEALSVDGAGNANGVSSWSIAPGASCLQLSCENSDPSQPHRDAESTQKPVRPPSPPSSSSSCSSGQRDQDHQSTSAADPGQKGQCRGTESAYRRGFLKRHGRRTGCSVQHNAAQEKEAHEKTSEEEQQISTVPGVLSTIHSAADLSLIHI